MGDRLTTKQKYYPWVIMVACCLYMGASIGIGTNCGSIFMPVLAKEFGVGLGISLVLLTVSKKMMAKERAAQ